MQKRVLQCWGRENTETSCDSEKRTSLRKVRACLKNTQEPAEGAASGQNWEDLSKNINDDETEITVIFLSALGSYN